MKKKLEVKKISRYKDLLRYETLLLLGTLTGGLLVSLGSFRLKVLGIAVLITTFLSVRSYVKMIVRLTNNEAY